MGIIDVNVEKPAFKRAEREEKTTEETETAKQTTSGGPEAPAANSGSGRTRLKSIGALAVGLLGIVTFRKLRNRRAEPGSESAMEQGKRTGAE